MAEIIPMTEEQKFQLEILEITNMKEADMTTKTLYTMTDRYT